MNRKDIIKHYKSFFALDDIPFRNLGKSDKLTIDWAEDLVKSLSPINEAQGKPNLKELARSLDEALSKETRESINEFLDSIGGYKWIEQMIQPSRSEEKPKVIGHFEYDFEKKTEKYVSHVDQPKEQPQSNYVQVIPATFDDYMKCSKEELITMLLECHRIMGIKGEPIADVQTFTATSYSEQPERRRTADLRTMLEDLMLPVWIGGMDSQLDSGISFEQSLLKDGSSEKPSRMTVKDVIDTLENMLQEYAREGVPSVSDEEIEAWGKNTAIRHASDNGTYYDEIFAELVEIGARAMRDGKIARMNQTNKEK